MNNAKKELLAKIVKAGDNGVPLQTIYSEWYDATILLLVDECATLEIIDSNMHIIGTLRGASEHYIDIINKLELKIFSMRDENMREEALRKYKEFEEDSSTWR